MDSNYIVLVQKFRRIAKVKMEFYTELAIVNVDWIL